MASDITLLKSFVDGQGAGATTYVTYAEDLDSNFSTIEAQFNSLNQAFNAFGGANQSLVLDLALSASPSVTAGFVGSDSFQPLTFLSADTQIQIPVGVAFGTTGSRVKSNSVFTLTGSGAVGFRFAALRADGTITLETATGQGVLDLWRFQWTGTDFDNFGDASPPLRLPSGGSQGIIVDADDFQQSKTQENISQSTSAVIPTFTYDKIASRINDIVRIMAGVRETTGKAVTSQPGGLGIPVGPTLSPMSVGGAVATPGMIIGNPTEGYDADSGLYGRGPAKVLGVAVDAAAVVEFTISGGNRTAQFTASTALANPGISFLGDPNTGIGWVAADTMRAITAGVAANEWNPQGQRNSATQGRASATRATLSLANNAVTALGLDTEQYDQTGFHDNVTNNDRMTVPTGFGGLYAISAYVEFLEASSAGTPNTGQRGVEITVNGTAVTGSRTDSTAAGDTRLVSSAQVVLAAADIVRVTGFQNSGGAMNVNARLALVHVD